MIVVFLKFIHVTVDVHQRNDIMLQGTWEEDIQPNDEAFEIAPPSFESIGNLHFSQIQDCETS